MRRTIQSLAIAAAIAGSQYTIVDAQGHVVGSIVTDTPPGATLRIMRAAVTQRAPGAPPAVAQQGFKPDYTHALSVEQMSRAWQAEVDRLMPQPIAGGG